MDTTISSVPREIPLGDTQRSKHWPNRVLSMNICDVQNLTKFCSDHFVFRLENAIQQTDSIATQLKL
jgi:hypothetical protein